MRSQTFFNPYDPPTPAAGARSVEEVDAYIVPFRLDTLTLLALMVSVLDTCSTLMYFTSGTGYISNTVLASLASKSVVWIPIYRMAIPLLIPFMPRTCRQSFAVFFITSGSAFALNNFSGHLFGNFVFVDNFGMIPTAIACALFGLMAFYLSVTQHGHFVHALRATFAWIVAACAIEYGFFLLGHII